MKSGVQKLKLLLKRLKMTCCVTQLTTLWLFTVNPWGWRVSYWTDTHMKSICTQTPH